MLRLLPALSSLTLRRTALPLAPRIHHHRRGAHAPPPSLQTLPPPPPTPDDTAAAHAWLAAFAAAPIPRAAVELRFARSSGPGGQHVNKTHSKAAVRCPLARAWIPRWAVPALTRTPAYAAAAHSLLVSSTRHRSQADNVADCLAKLHRLILAAARSAVPVPADAARLARKAGHARAEKARRRAGKEARAAVKAGRAGRAGGWD